VVSWSAAPCPPPSDDVGLADRDVGLAGLQVGTAAPVGVGRAGGPVRSVAIPHVAAGRR
jgi:hypothetical protein